MSRRTITLKKYGQNFDISFVFCSPGKYRIVYGPILEAKNTVIEYSKGFWMQEMTVSMGLYEFVNDESYYENGLSRADNLLFPWHGMDFFEIKSFLEKLNYIVVKSGYAFALDVPSICEWEHALFCGKDKIWSWGDDADELTDYAWFRDNSGNKVHLAKQKKPNEWGIYDMYGNVYEYCLDCQFDSDKSYFINPKPVPAKADDVLPCMGGAYDCNSDQCYGYYYIGFNNSYIEPTGIRLIIRESGAV